MSQKNPDRVKLLRAYEGSRLWWHPTWVRSNDSNKWHIALSTNTALCDTDRAPRSRPWSRRNTLLPGHPPLEIYDQYQCKRCLGILRQFEVTEASSKRAFPVLESIATPLLGGNVSEQPPAPAPEPEQKPAEPEVFFKEHKAAQPGGRKGVDDYGHHVEPVEDTEVE